MQVTFEDATRPGFYVSKTNCYEGIARVQPLQQASVCKRGCLPNYTTLACDHSWVVNWTAADDVSLFTTEPSPHPYFVEDNITYYGNLALSPEKIGEGVTFGAEFLGGGFTPLVHPTDANNLPNSKPELGILARADIRSTTQHFFRAVQGEDDSFIIQSAHNSSLSWLIQSDDTLALTVGLGSRFKILDGLRRSPETCPCKLAFQGDDLKSVNPFVFGAPKAEVTTPSCMKDINGVGFPEQ